MTRPLLACLAALLVLAGCADAPETETPGQLDFALPELAGGQVVGAELAGQHLALWFWTPW